MELLELYSELLLARFGLLDQKCAHLVHTPLSIQLTVLTHSTPEPDPGVSEGVCAIIHAAPRTELKGIHHCGRKCYDSLKCWLTRRTTYLKRYLDAQVWARFLNSGNGKQEWLCERAREYEHSVYEYQLICRCQVTRKLSTLTPPPKLVDAYLGEIARGYGIDWSPPGEPKDEDNDNGGEGGVKVSRHPS